MEDRGGRASGVRLPELLGALSLGVDLGMGHPMEHVLRQSLIALRLAGRMGIGDAGREVVYYASMLAWVGCHVDAYEQAKWFGDESVFKADARLVDLGRPVPTAGYVLRHVGRGRPAVRRARLGLTFLGEGRRSMMAMFENHWRTADALAVRLGLGDDVRASVAQTFERWDGKGEPEGVAGDDLAVPSRLVNLADVVEVFHRAGGVDAAVAVARDRRGTQFDPALVDLFCADAPAILAEAAGEPSWDAVLAALPSPGPPLDGPAFDDALAAVAEFVDLKSPYLIGHSGAVAALARAAGTAYGLATAEVTTLSRAALVHDLGRLGISNTVWDKPGPLSTAEMERVRLHPYLTERMLAPAPALASLGVLAGQHHERLDGSGYPRGLTGDALSPAARLLAAADAYQSKREPRPHRPAADAVDAAGALNAEVAAGRLDGAAVAAVLAAAGHRTPRRRAWPAGLTSREVEVLRLLARGLSQKEIARRLVISRKTASNHVEHIYAKIGVSNRALASVFAIRHGLMTGEDGVDAS